MEDSMSEEQKQATTETASESPATETANHDQVSELIAESKKYRKRSQEAEAKLAKYEKAKAQAEEDRLKEKEEFKTLYEQASSKIENLTANAEKWSKYEEAKRTALLESHPEGERESLSNLDLETLEYVTNKINTVKPNAPETVGNARGKNPEIQLKDFKSMSKQDKQKHWDNFMKQYKPR